MFRSLEPRDAPLDATLPLPSDRPPCHQGLPDQLALPHPHLLTLRPNTRLRLPLRVERPLLLESLVVLPPLRRLLRHRRPTATRLPPRHPLGPPPLVTSVTKCHKLVSTDRRPLSTPFDQTPLARVRPPGQAPGPLVLLPRAPRARAHLLDRGLGLLDLLLHVGPARTKSNRASPTQSLPFSPRTTLTWKRMPPPLLHLNQKPGTPPLGAPHGALSNSSIVPLVQKMTMILLSHRSAKILLRRPTIRKSRLIFDSINRSRHTSPSLHIIVLYSCISLGKTSLYYFLHTVCVITVVYFINSEFLL